MDQTNEQIVLTEDEWVRAVNQKAREIELCVAFVHPTTWPTMTTYHILKEEFLTLVKTPTHSYNNMVENHSIYCEG